MLQSSDSSSPRRWVHPLRLFVLLLATCGLALPASAQSITPPDWEFALEAHNRDVTVYVFDLDGFLVHFIRVTARTAGGTATAVERLTLTR